MTSNSLPCAEGFFSSDSVGRDAASSSIALAACRRSSEAMARGIAGRLMGPVAGPGPRSGGDAGLLPQTTWTKYKLLSSYNTTDTMSLSLH